MVDLDKFCMEQYRKHLEKEGIQPASTPEEWMREYNKWIKANLEDVMRAYDEKMRSFKNKGVR
jgi:hypothetical protein